MPVLQMDDRKGNNQHIIKEANREDRLFPGIDDHNALTTLINVLEKKLCLQKNISFDELDVPHGFIDSFGAALIETVLNIQADGNKTDNLYGKKLPLKNGFQHQLRQSFNTDLELVLRIINQNIERKKTRSYKTLPSVAAEDFCSAFRFSFEQLVANADEHAKQAKVVSWRYRLSTPTDKLQFPHELLEVAFSSSISKVRQSMVPQFKEQVTDRESIFFALLPGFSCVGGLRKPELGSDRGTALFYLSQTARYGGALLIQSGSAILQLGMIGPSKRVEYDCRISEIPLDQISNPELRELAEYQLGTTFALQSDATRFSHHAVVRQVSQYCARSFWEKTFGSDSVTLEDALKKSGSLEKLYFEYLVQESNALKSDDLLSTVLSGPTFVAFTKDKKEQVEETVRDVTRILSWSSESLIAKLQ